MTCKARKINKLFGYEYDPVTLKKIKGIDYVTSKTVNNVNDQNLVTLETTEKALLIPQIAPAKVDDDDGFDKMLMEAFVEEEARMEEE
ncbi:16221_t:CDS:2, partial [Acaulospora colombiana]